MTNSLHKHATIGIVIYKFALILSLKIEYIIFR